MLDSHCGCNYRRFLANGLLLSRVPQILRDSPEATGIQPIRYLRYLWCSEIGGTSVYLKQLWHIDPTGMYRASVTRVTVLTLWIQLGRSNEATVSGVRDHFQDNKTLGIISPYLRGVEKSRVK